ncbi:MAG: PINc/VapC family ATPase [Nitrososphaeraceae archaeon]
MKTKKFVLDTSIIIDREIVKLIKNGQIEEDSEIMIPIPVLDELQSQASINREQGYIGLEEIQNIKRECRNNNIFLNFIGKRPDYNDILLAKNGRIDSIINEIALNEKACLITADFVQDLSAKAHGIESIFIKHEKFVKKFKFEEFFGEKIMSVHLKEGVVPTAKEGKPGKFKLIKLTDKITTKEDLKKIIKEIDDKTPRNGYKFNEIERNGARVIQYEKFRITITQPPFSDSIEVTIVKPIVQLSLKDYELSTKLYDRLENNAEGIIIAGSPGSGKSTFASSLAEFYVEKGKIVKTFESPRDLQVPKEVTQYGPLEGSFENAIDLLLMVRPDYTIFDEVRRLRDFDVYADMRLSGVGMIGIIHANNPVDAVQRFIGKIEMGVIPHILDTIIFIKDGKITKVLELKLTVKVPSGMTEEDLARPIVEIFNFETKELEYEIYTYGEESVVIPVFEIKKTEKNDNDKIRKLAESKIKDMIRRFDPLAEIQIISNNKVRIKVEKEILPKIIGRGGSTITELENTLGIKIDVEAKTPVLGEKIKHDISESGSSIILMVDKKEIGNSAGIYIENEFILSSQIGKKSRIKIDKRSEYGKKIVNAIIANAKIELFKIQNKK